MPFNGGGFGRAPLAGPLDWFAPSAGADPWAPTAGTASTQAAGVVQYGAIWASKGCASCNTAIHEMQGQVNRVAGVLGVPVHLTVDGKVGAGTVTAFQAVARGAVARGVLSATSLLAYGSAEVIAKNADKARDLLRSIGDKLGASAVAPPVVSASSAPTGPATMPDVSLTLPGAELPLTIAKPSKLPYIIGGAILLVGVAATVYILRTPKA